jgi:DNA (cytosine-5)-methyltransferase 1
MNHIDLFSGIGGFAYAARQVWPYYHNLFFCDNNKFCQAVLRKNFGKDILIYNDIKEVNYERFIADTKLRGHIHGEIEIESTERHNETFCEPIASVRPSGIQCDLLTGGFPCQPFSVAGKREGRDDDRHLWPEMFRVIKAFAPRWVIGENVRGLINIENGMAFEQVCLDLESIGYTVQAFVIPAVAVNAPHRRDRVWIIAHAGSVGQTKQEQQTAGSEQSDSHAADTEIIGNSEGNPGNQVARISQGTHTITGRSTGWDQPWLEVATRLCRVDDGLPAGVDRIAKGIKGGYRVRPGGNIGEYLISKSKHREERLKALGNAIVPQVAMEIMRAIQCAI